MPKAMQNVVLLMEPNDDTYFISLKAGKLLLNRFCIDEDAAFESTGVYYLKRVTEAMKWRYWKNQNFRVAVPCRKWELEEKSKGQRSFFMTY